ADAINGIAPGLLAEQARACGACLIHYSTDYVFDGSKIAFFSEGDPPRPINAYGRTKLAGEQAVAAAAGTHLILRTSWLYGARGRNFFLTVLRLARGTTPMRIVDDQLGAPTWARSVAELTGQIVAQSLQQEADWLGERTGIYHVTAAESCSWHEFARAILEQTGNQAALARLHPTSSDAYPLKAARPAYSILDCERLWQTFGLRLGPWREALSRVTEDLQLHIDADSDSSAG
ncbi:MAG: dTDP-4-dehydrorhamnose reductase, partial [Gammaproteobacteria bacterium]